MTDKREKKLALLKKQYDMSCHNLLCYSSNYSLDPKEDYETEHAQAREECDLLEEMIKELAAPEIATQEQPVITEAQVEEARQFVTYMQREKKMSIVDLSELIPCSHATLSLFEHGKYNNPRLVQLVLDCKELFV
jgi:DNA-binding Xre family transcriptional regulator